MSVNNCRGPLPHSNFQLRVWAGRGRKTARLGVFRNSISYPWQAPSHMMSERLQLTSNFGLSKFHVQAFSRCSSENKQAFHVRVYTQYITQVFMYNNWLILLILYEDPDRPHRVTLVFVGRKPLVQTVCYVMILM